MIDAVRLLYWEMIGFFFLLIAILTYRMLTRSIPLTGLLLRKDGSGQVSPERVQLLLATLAVSFKYIGAALHSNNGTMPEIGASWLLVFGGSSGIYVSVKAFTTWKSKQ